MAPARTLALPLVGLALVVACSESENTEDTAPQDSVAHQDTATPGVAPTITEGTWECTKADSGPAQLVAQLEADDPQGADTIAPMGGVVEISFPDDVEPLWSFELVCDADGDCFGSIEYSGGDCDFEHGMGLVARATVLDEDGNVSVPFALTWLD
jgi:hypothetical protein